MTARAALCLLLAALATNCDPAFSACVAVTACENADPIVGAKVHFEDYDAEEFTDPDGIACYGNVGELRNMVKRLLILGGNEEISLEEVEAQLSAAAPGDELLVKQDLLAMPLREARERFERAYLQQQLLLCGGKVGQLAKRVGMERTHLYRKLKALGIDPKETG